jgi:hypothetical protein
MYLAFRQKDKWGIDQALSFSGKDVLELYEGGESAGDALSPSAPTLAAVSHCL